MIGPLLCGGVIIALSATLCTAETTSPIDESALYFYKAHITDVYDGDTITADVDLGFYTWLHEQRFRLHGIDAPEVRGESKIDGLRCRDLLASQIKGKEVLIQSIKSKRGNDEKEKYGRYLAVVWLGKANVNDWLVNQKCAVRKEY